MTRPTAITQTTDIWYEHIHPRKSAALRLFCLPYAGGAAYIFREWQGSLPQDVEVRPIQVPGRGRRMGETPFRRLNELVEELAFALGPLDKPFALFGHSMGALIQFELARYLERRGGPRPLQLFLAGRRAPHMPSTEPSTYELPDAEFLAEIERLNGTPREILTNPEALALHMPILRADFELVQTYSYLPGTPLRCAMTVYGGEDDTDVTNDCLAGWRQHTTGPFNLRMIPGDHFFVTKSRDLVLNALCGDLRLLVSRMRAANYC
jgi:surfactin synthase thioesterase subunit